MFPSSLRSAPRYCDTFPDENGRTCRNVGAITAWTKKRENDDVFMTYRREYKKRFARIRSGTLLPEDFYRWSEQARQKKDELEAGEIEEMIPCGCPEGTTMICRDLFYNTPARLKFLKSDRSEASACITAALRCALGRPDVSVRLIRDGKEEFFSEALIFRRKRFDVLLKEEKYLRLSR